MNESRRLALLVIASTVGGCVASREPPPSDTGAAAAATVPAADSANVPTAQPATVPVASVKRPAPAAPSGGKGPAAVPSHDAAGSGAGATSPAPRPPADSEIIISSGTPALVVFRDSVGIADLEWLRAQGMTVGVVNRGGHSVSVHVPSSYSGNPRANPRILRFSIAMR